MVKKSEPVVGGIKGFFQKASVSFTKGGTWLSTQTLWLGQKALYVGFVIASTSFITLMPLLIEIGREVQVRKRGSVHSRAWPTKCRHAGTNLPFLPFLFIKQSTGFADD